MYAFSDITPLSPWFSWALGNTRGKNTIYTSDSVCGVLRDYAVIQSSQMSPP